MKDYPDTLVTRLRILAQAVEFCEAARQKLLAVQSKLQESSQQQQNDLRIIHDKNRSLLDEQISRLTDQAQAQRETLDLDLRTETESFESRQRHNFEQKEAEISEKVGRMAERENNEIWVLNSVLDEAASDTPVERLEREKESLESQRLSTEQRQFALQQQIAQSRELLTDCHAGTDITWPKPRARLLPSRDPADAARESGDQLLAEAAGLQSAKLPQWIRGSRLWMIGTVLSLVIFFPTVLVEADLTSFLNPELGQPDWRWLGISVVTALVLSVFFCVLCLVIVQQRMHRGFECMLRHAVNAEWASSVSHERAQQRLKKLERSANKWLAELRQRREQKKHRIHQQFADERQSFETQLSDAQSQFVSDCQAHETRLRQQYDADRARIDSWEAEHRQRLDREANQRLDQETRACGDKYTADSQSLQSLAEQQLKGWQQQLQRIRDLIQKSGQLAEGGCAQPSLHPAHCHPPEAMPSAISAGDLLITVPKTPTSITERSETSLCLEMPAVMPFPGNISTVVEHDVAGREAAVRFLRTRVLQLMTAIPPGRIRLTLIDPVGLGQSFSALMHLADYDELLVHSRIRTEESQIREQLRKITEHMENVFQTYLRSEFATIEDYNASAGEVAEPYHVVVIAGFPHAFSEEASRHLSSILTSGPNCGVHTLVAWNPAVAAPPGFDIAELTNECAHFRVRDGWVVPAFKLPSTVVFEAYPEPSSADYIAIVRAVGEQSKDVRRVEVSFRRIAPRSDAVWTQSTAEGIDLPVGRAGAARLQFLRLGRGTSQHVMVAGKTGSGKSTFLHIVVANLALHYSPSEIQFYLIDFKKGVEFRTYAANRLPHARVIAIESDREFGLSVLERLDEILQERGELFRARGVQDVPSFRRQFPSELMPRLLLLIDEFQEFFVAEDRVASRASLLLDRLVRQGRAFGIHVLLGSQTLGGAYSLARSTLGQVAVRVALQCSESDAHLILSEDNAAARLLTRPGEAIYNDANGLREGNHSFQIAWLGEDDREQLIRDLANRRTVSSVDTSMIVFEGNVAPTVEQCGPLRAMLRSSAAATRSTTDICTIWLGEPVAIAAPMCVQLRRAGGQNLLLVGQDADVIDSILCLATLSACGPSSSVTQVTLLHSGCHQQVVRRFGSLKTSGAVDGFDLQPADSCESVIRASYAELARREDLAEHADAPEMMLVIYDIGQFRELRREEDDFSLGSFGEPKEETTASMLGELIRRGPLVGLHVVVWADTCSNAMRWLSNTLLREFENRIALRMNQTDSASLVDSSVASGLGPGRAILYRDQIGTIEKFRPFAWPSDDWLSQAASWRVRTTFDGLDIESLQIE